MPTEIVGFPVDVTAEDADNLKRARQQLAGGQRYRQTQRHTIWKRSEKQYEGDHWGQVNIDDPTADLITVNMSFSTHNTIVPFVTGENPRFIVEPYSIDATVTNARLQQAFLNRLWEAERTGAQEALELAVSDSIIYGDGYLKVAYQMREKRLAFDATAEVADVYVDRVSPWDVWIDPNATGIHNARWICHRIFTTRRELEAQTVGDDAPYKKSAVDKIGFGRVQFESQDRESEFHTDEIAADEEEWAVLFEFYDLVDNIMYTFTDTGDLPLRKVEEVKPSIVQIGAYRIPRSPYHMGDLEQIWSMQQELNKTRSQLATHRRRNIAKYLIKEDAIGEEARAALTSPIVSEFVPIKGDQPLSDLVVPVNLQPLSADVYGSADFAVRDIFEVTGVNEYQRGASPEIRRTATEASIIEGSANVKTRAKLRMVERAVKRAGILILDIARTVFPETDFDEMGLFVTGEDAKQIQRAMAGEAASAALGAGDLEGAQLAADELSLDQDVEFAPEPAIFEGEYEVHVESSSTELRNPIVREQKFRQMLELLVNMAPQLQQMGVPVNVRPILEKYLEAAGIVDVDGVVSGAPLQPDPNAQFSAEQDQLTQLLGQQADPNLGAAQAPAGILDAGNTGQFPPA